MFLSLPCLRWRAGLSRGYDDSDDGDGDDDDGNDDYCGDDDDDGDDGDEIARKLDSKIDRQLGGCSQK